MSTGKEAAACGTASDDDRLKMLESQMRQLDEKTRSQENSSLKTKHRLEEVACEAEMHKTEIVGMLETFIGPNTEDGVKEISSKGDRYKRPPEVVSSKRKNEDVAGN